MKNLLIIAAFLFAGAAQADMVSIKSMKCSLFGNLKIKVNGLERHRNLGTGYLKANVPLFDSCKDALSEVRGRMGRSTQNTTVDVTKRIVREVEHRGNDRNKMDTVCHIYEVKTLKMVFNRMPELTFRRMTRKHLRTTYGWCR